VPFFPPEASSFAGHVDALYGFLIALTAFFSILIATLVIYFAIKYRRRSPDDIAAPVHDSHVLELVWTAIPLGIVMVIFVWGAGLYFRITRPPADAIDIYVTGKQWMWKIQHSDGHREMNELHVPVGQAVRLTMASEDVIHSFYVPAFRMKADVVPGRYTTTWFQPTRVGEYHLFCAEYCGTQHSGMIGRVVVMEPGEYQVWLSEKAAAPSLGSAGGGVQPASVSPAAAGEALFRAKGCVSCHQQQAGALGPSLIGLFGSRVKLQDGSEVTADDAYVRESILHPTAKVVAGFQPVMPTFQGQLDEEQVLQLIQYIKSLKPTGDGGPGGVAAAPADAAPPAS
jgi:cytochrome c oxidase subunit 2